MNHFPQAVASKDGGEGEERQKGEFDDDAG